jgi:hypothetical protein
MAGRDQVHRDMLLVKADVGPGPDPRLQGGGNGAAGGVRGMHHPTVAVPPLPGEVIAPRCAIFVAPGEGHALVQEPLDIAGAVLHHSAHHPGIAESSAGAQGILDMGVHRVRCIEDRRDPPLRVEGAALGELPLRDHCDGQVLGEPQGEAETGGAAAEDQDIVSVNGVGHEG